MDRDKLVSVVYHIGAILIAIGLCAALSLVIWDEDWRYGVTIAIAGAFSVWLSFILA